MAAATLSPRAGSRPGNRDSGNHYYAAAEENRNKKCPGKALRPGSRRITRTVQRPGLGPGTWPGTDVTLPEPPGHSKSAARRAGHCHGPVMPGHRDGTSTARRLSDSEPGSGRGTGTVWHWQRRAGGSRAESATRADGPPREEPGVGLGRTIATITDDHHDNDSHCHGLRVSTRHWQGRRRGADSDSECGRGASRRAASGSAGPGPALAHISAILDDHCQDGRARIGPIIGSTPTRRVRVCQ
jgi:hypothetical protein